MTNVRYRPLASLSRLAVVLALSSLGAVAHAALFEDDDARRAILELRQRVEASRQTTDASIQRLVDSLEMQARRNADDNAQLRRSMLDLQNQIESLRGEIARLTGQNEQATREVAELQRRQKDVLQGMQGVEQRVDQRFKQFEPVKVTLDGRTFDVQPTERDDYEAALAKFRAGDYAGAQSAFLGLIARYPRSGYGTSALFWLGNAQYALRDYKEAIGNFRILLTNEPSHVRAPETMLSIANCQVELKDVRGARKTLEDLGKQYPQSEAAAAAKDRLARLR